MTEYDLHHERMRNALTRIKAAEIETRRPLNKVDTDAITRAVKEFVTEVRKALVELGDV